LKPVHLDATKTRNKNHNKHNVGNRYDARQINNQKRPDDCLATGDGFQSRNLKDTSKPIRDAAKVRPSAVGGVISWRQGLTFNLSSKTNLLPRIVNNKSYSLSAKPSIRDRTKYPRLVGADVYVARLSNCGMPVQLGQCDADAHLSQHGTGDCRGLNTTPSESSPVITLSSPLTGSLHDEIKSRGNMKSMMDMGPDTETDDYRPKALESRPCYRCVAYMHTVGIKRVFWTNANGRWEGAKVRDLVDMMDATLGEGSSGVDEGERVMDRIFVTKHEVLMLRRLMGQTSFESSRRSNPKTSQVS
jgi:hypothetical protein